MTETTVGKVVTKEGLVVNIVRAPPLVGYRFDALITNSMTREKVEDVLSLAIDLAITQAKSL